jgi:hypothetical protein
MSVDITARVRIAREPAAVAAYMTDPAHDREWIGGLREAELVDEPPIGVGSRVRRVAHFLGRRVEYVNEIVALDAGQLDMRSVKAPFPMRITYRGRRHARQQPRARRRPAPVRPARPPQRPARPRTAARRPRGGRLGRLPVAPRANGGLQVGSCGLGLVGVADAHSADELAVALEARMLPRDLGAAVERAARCAGRTRTAPPWSAVSWS